MTLFLLLCFVAAASAVEIPASIVHEGADTVPIIPEIDAKTYWQNVGRSLRFNPAWDNQYHLFTRQNPSWSQPLVQGLPNTLSQSNYGRTRRTVIVVHGMNGNAASHFNQVVTPALLRSNDVNVINVDWRIGAAQGGDVIGNAARSGQAVANFINWLMGQTGQNAGQFIIIGFSLGGLKAGNVGRHVWGDVSYIVALDLLHRPGLPNAFRPNDARYTEAIRTAVEGMGDQPAAHVDFYTNGGDRNPGCGGDFGCNHARAYVFFAESLISGGFTGRRCANLAQARTQNCNQQGTLRMGGLSPKTGQQGIFLVQTNANSPFSRG